MFDMLFGDKTTKLKVVMAVGAAIVAVYEAATTIQDCRSENNENQENEK